MGSSTPEIGDSGTSRRSGLVALAIVALLIVVVLGARLVRPGGPEVANGAQPTPTAATPAPVAPTVSPVTPTAAPSPLPSATPTPQQIEPRPSPTPLTELIGTETWIWNAQILGEDLYYIDDTESRLWTSADRGRTGELLLRLPSNVQPRLTWGCTVKSGTSMATPVTSSERASARYMSGLMIVADGLVEVIDLPRRAQTTGRLLDTCRAVEFDGIWYLASLDRERNEIIIDSIADQEVTEYRIDLTGPWADVLEEVRQDTGFIHLYRDGDRMVVSICNSSFKVSCIFTDLSFDHSLVSPGAPTSISAQAAADANPSLFFPPNDHPFGAAEELFQVGDQLWRADHDEAVGECYCGEGGSLAPFYSFVGGSFTGDSEDPGTRTVDYRLFKGQVLRCGYIFPTEIPPINPDATQKCSILNAAGDWQSVSGPFTVDWATVPAGTDVTFVERDDQGRILVTPTN